MTTQYVTAGVVNTIDVNEVPGSGQVVYIRVLSARSTPRTISAMSGLGATWALHKDSGGATPREVVWKGTGASATGTVTVTMSGTQSCTIGALIAPDVTAGDTVVETPVLGAGTTVAGPSSSAELGKTVWALAWGATTPITTWVDAPNPASGWTSAIQDSGGSAFRTPAGSAETHQVSITVPTGGTTYVGQVILGAAAPPDPPGAPTDLAVDMTTTTGELTWAAPDTGDEPTGYRVRINGASLDDVGLVLTNTFFGLLPGGTEYLFEVQAYSAVGFGPWASIEGVTDDPVIPPPSSLPPGHQSIPLPSPHDWKKIQRQGWRYFATRVNGDGTETFLDPDLPLEDVNVEDVLSGDGALSAKIDPSYARLLAADGKPLLDEWSTAIYAEQSGAIRFAGILTHSEFDGPQWDLEATSWTGYARDLPYVGPGYKGIEVDPIDVVREIWDHIQSKRGGDIGFQIDTTDTNGEVTIGTELRQVEFDTQSGPVSFEAGPYKMNQYTTHNLASNIDKLANETPFDYHERHWWDGDDIVHFLDIGYPQIGRRRTDLRFVFGVNIFDPMQVERDGSIYASGTLVLGAGTGPSMITSVSEPPERPGNRLRRVAVVVDDTIKSKKKALLRANAENQWRARLDDIDSVLVHDHPNAPLGSAGVGDEIRLEGQGDWIDIDMWVRILGISYQPAIGNVAEYRVARTDRLMS